MTLWRERGEEFTFLASAVLLTAGVVAWVAGAETTAEAVWWVATGLGLILSTVWLVHELRAGHFGVDVVAWLALAGTLLVDESLAGAIITLMLTTGRVLEARAQARAQRELTLLVARAPRTARRIDGDEYTVVPVDDVRPGDRLLVASGEVVPVDGRVLGAGSFDESSLTGEADPVERAAGEEIRSGVINAGVPVQMLATTLASQSTYSQIVRLVEEAQAASSPFVRTADRFAAVFVPVTLVLSGVGVVDLRRPGARGGGPRGGNALSAAPGCADRDHVRALSGGQGRRSGEGRRGARAARRGEGAPLRQDGNADSRTPRGDHGDRRGRRCAPIAAARGEPGPGVAARPRRRHRDARRRTSVATAPTHRRAGGARIRIGRPGGRARRPGRPARLGVSGRGSRLASSGGEEGQPGGSADGVRRRRRSAELCRAAERPPATGRASDDSRASICGAAARGTRDRRPRRRSRVDRPPRGCRRRACRDRSAGEGRGRRR